MKFMTCFNIGGDAHDPGSGAVAAVTTQCTCGGPADGSFQLEYAADGTACASANVISADDVNWWTMWLGSTKLMGTTKKLPGFLDADLTAMSTGAWTTVSCYAVAEEAAAGTGYTACATEYAILRALWDDLTFTTAQLTAGGLDATKIPDLLFDYEVNKSDTATWDDLATFFAGSKTTWADSGFKRADFGDIFCKDGALLDAADIEVQAGFNSETGDFDLESLQWLLSELDFELGGTFDSAFTASDYLWLSAICPGDGSTTFADHLEAWFDLLLVLADPTKEGGFPRIADCNPTFKVTDATPEVKTDPLTTLCLPCPVADAKGVTT